MTRLPWNVRFALAAHAYGWKLPDHLLMSVQMLRNGGGCSSCAHPYHAASAARAAGEAS